MTQQVRRDMEQKEQASRLLEFATQHDATSCSDTYLANRFPSKDGYVSCTRCFLLAVVGGVEAYKNVNVAITIRIGYQETIITQTKRVIS